MSLLKILLFTAVVLLTIELSARIEDFFRWEAPLSRSYQLSNLQYADDLGRRCRPDGRYKHFVLDGNGFRKTPIEDSSAPKAYLFGASEAFGLYESPGQEFAAQLEDQLHKSNKHWNIINAACVGMSTPHVVNYLRSRGQNLSPSRIIYYPTPHFYLDNSRPVVKAIAADRIDTPEGRILHSRFIDKFGSVLKSFLPAALQDWLRGQIIKRQMTKHEMDWVWSSPPPDRLAAFEADLVELVDLVKSSNADLVLMTHANAFQGPDSDVGQLNAWRRFYPRATGETLVKFDELANNIVRKVAREQGVLLVDVSKTVTTRSAFADFSHFSDEGSRQVVQELIQVF